MKGYGALRDTLGAVSNLQQLLRSRNVAPKAIGTILPDVHSCCTPLVEELQVFRDQLVEKVDPAALGDLVNLIQEQVAKLEAETKQKPRRNMTASARLRLERSVAQIARSLSGALPLAELLAEATEPVPQAFDLLELLQLSRVGDQPQTPGARAIQAEVEAHIESAPVLCNPRVMLSLLGLGAALLALDGDAPKIRVILSQPEPGDVEVRLQSAAQPSPNRATAELMMLVPRAVPPTAACLAAAATACGLLCERDETSIRFRWHTS